MVNLRTRHTGRKSNLQELTPLALPSSSPELALHFTLWLLGKYPDLWASKNKMLLLRAFP